MRRTFRSALARFVAVGALSGSFTHAQPRDITLPELLGGPDGDAIREPDTMPAPKPTVPQVDEDGRITAPKVAKPASPRAPVASPAKAKPPAKRAPDVAAAKIVARAKPVPPKPAPPVLIATRLRPTLQEKAPARVHLPDESASTPSFVDIPEPQVAEPEVEAAQQDSTPETPRAETDDRSFEEQVFESDFAAIDAIIQRGVRRGDFTRRQAVSLFAELDDIANMENYYRRFGQIAASDRARVADRLADLRDWLSRRTPE